MAGEEGGEEEKRLVDLRRSSLMALPQVKMNSSHMFDKACKDSSLIIGLLIYYSVIIPFHTVHIFGNELVSYERQKLLRFLLTCWLFNILLSGNNSPHCLSIVFTLILK